MQIFFIHVNAVKCIFDWVAAILAQEDMGSHNLQATINFNASMDK